jgi:prepilin-type N-terminal cleavage/methylation domain-containing protein
MTRKTGFTLIELLVVIAIIAILAAIIFPVFMRAKESAYRAGDLSNMNAIRNAIQLYRADQEAYPPQILGYGTPYMPGPQLAQVVPANQLHAALYPKRIQSVESLRPAFDKESNDTTTVAVWPNADSRAVGSAPILDLNGDGVVDATDDIPGARQAYGPTVYFCLPSPSLPGCVQYASNAAADGAPFYKISGYDVANVKVPPSGAPDRWEIHYTLQWTSYALGGGNRSDDPRQLIYNEPPDNTVVTWDSWFRDYNGANVVSHDKKDFVLFLNGGARAYDSANLSDRSWRVTP